MANCWINCGSVRESWAFVWARRATAKAPSAAASRGGIAAVQGLGIVVEGLGVFLAAVGRQHEPGFDQELHGLVEQRLGRLIFVRFGNDLVGHIDQLLIPLADPFGLLLRRLFWRKGLAQKDDHFSQNPFRAPFLGSASSCGCRGGSPVAGSALPSGAFSAAFAAGLPIDAVGKSPVPRTFEPSLPKTGVGLGIAAARCPKSSEKCRPDQARAREPFQTSHHDHGLSIR